MKIYNIFDNFPYVSLFVSSENCISHAKIRKIELIIDLKYLLSHYFLSFNFMNKKYTRYILYIFKYCIGSYLYLL